MSCVFCDIVDGREPASLVHEDPHILAFMDIRPVRPGQLLVIPKQHTDHFIDLPAALAADIFTTGRKLARALRQVFVPARVGMIVHGFGVAHAHLIVVPLEQPSDITSAQCATMENGSVVFRWEQVPLAPRSELDAIAEELRNTLAD